MIIVEIASALLFNFFGMPAPSRFTGDKPGGPRKPGGFKPGGFKPRGPR